MSIVLVELARWRASHLFFRRAHEGAQFAVSCLLLFALAIISRLIRHMIANVVHKFKINDLAYVIFDNFCRFLRCISLARSNYT